MSTRAACYRARVAFTAALCLYFAVLAESQPTQCSVPGSSFDGRHCDDGHYCDPDVFICRECLRCEDFKREPSAIYSSCVKSVVECGPCTKGLVEDHRVGDVNAPCIPRSSGDEDGFPMYGWVLVALLCLVVMALFAGILWYVLKHPDTLKVLASTSTSMQSRCDRPAAPPTAPDQPPPYYAAVQPVSPSPPPTAEYLPAPPYNNEYPPNDEESSLIAKHPLRGELPPRESAGSQAARVFNNPVYVRGAIPSNGYNLSPLHGADVARVEENDEETVPSTWTPTVSCDQNDNTLNGTASSSAEGVPSSAQLPALLAAARNTSLIRPPHTENALQPYVPIRQDPNNNASRGSGDSSSVYGEGDCNSNPGQGSSFIINVIQNINTLPKRGDGGH